MVSPYEFGNIVGSCDTGLIVDKEYGYSNDVSIINPDTFEIISRFEHKIFHQFSDYLEENGSLYYFGITYHSTVNLLKYDFVDWSTIRNMNGDRDENLHSVAVNTHDKTFYAYYDDSIIKISLDGKVSKVINMTDINISVQDMIPFKFYWADTFYITKDEKNIIFKDNDNIRIMQKQ